MNTHLAKAKEALEAMKQYEPSDLAYGDLLSIGNLQARLAIATSLERIATGIHYDLSAKWGDLAPEGATEDNPLAHTLSRPVNPSVDSNG